MAVVNKSTVTVNKPVVNKNGEYVKNKKVKFKRNNKNFKKQVREDSKLIRSFEKVYDSQTETKMMAPEKVILSSGNVSAVIDKRTMLDPNFKKEVEVSGELLDDFDKTYSDIEKNQENIQTRHWSYRYKQAGEYLSRTTIANLCMSIYEFVIATVLLCVEKIKNLKIFKNKRKDS